MKRRCGILVRALLASLIVLAGTTMPRVAAPVSAQTPGSAITVYPAIIDNTVDAGAEFTSQVTVVNPSPQATAFQVTAGGLATETANQTGLPDSYNAASWLRPSPNSFVLLTNETRVVDVKFTVPKDAEPGGHYATLYFEAFLPSSNDPGQTTINSRVGVVVFLTVNGEIKENFSAGKKLEMPSFQGQTKPIDIGLTLKNGGNVHLMPSGTVRVRNLFGRTTATLPIASPGTVLPGSERKYEVSWYQGLRFGAYKVSATVTAGTRGEQVTFPEQWIFVVPLVIVIPAAALIVLTVLVLMIRRSLKKRRAKRSQEQARKDLLAMVQAAEEPDGVPTDTSGLSNDSEEPSDVDVQASVPGESTTVKSDSDVAAITEEPVSDSHVETGEKKHRRRRFDRRFKR